MAIVQNQTGVVVYCGCSLVLKGSLSNHWGSFFIKPLNSFFMFILRYLLVFAYSFLFIPVFGLLMLDPAVKNTTTILLATIYTFLSVFYFLAAFKDLKFVKQIILSFPIFYLIIATYLKADSWYFIINPIVIGNLILCLAVFFNKYYKNLLIYVCFISGSCIYTFFIYDFWIKSTYEVVNVESIINERHLDEKINIFDFAFINKNKETIKLNSTHYILIETWNEKCTPCIESMRDLENLIESYNFNIVHYYLYEPNNNFSMKLVDKVLRFKGISSKNKILIDYDSKFFVSSGMKSYPVFLLFSPDGKLVDYFSGYARSEKAIFKSRLRKLLDKSLQSKTSTDK